MHIKVLLEPIEGAAGPRGEFQLECGASEQILRWVGSAACGRLAIERGDVMGQYVPQAILDHEGIVMDADTILCEAFQDGADVKVLYSNGPSAFTIKWDGRPKTPPFKWGIHGEELPPFDAWLSEMDLATEPLVTSLLPSLLLMDAGNETPYNAAEDCEALHQVVQQNAGAIQATYLYIQCSGQKQTEFLGRLFLPQFRAFIQAVSSEFPLEKADEIFTTVALSESSTERKGNTESSCYLDLQDFFLATMQLASEWKPNSSEKGYNENSANAGNSLTARFGIFWNEACGRGMVAEMSAKIEKLKNVMTAQTEEILCKNRKLTEQTLESCQTKRIRSTEFLIELRHLCSHFTRWALLGKEFSIQDLVLMTIGAKQKTHRVEDYALFPEPLSVNYDEFERLLLAISWHMCLLQKKRDQFPSFLTETLDDIYRKAGVLAEIQKS